VRPRDRGQRQRNGCDDFLHGRAKDHRLKQRSRMPAIKTEELKLVVFPGASKTRTFSSHRYFSLWGVQ
jgi:hypothetical protein